MSDNYKESEKFNMHINNKDKFVVIKDFAGFFKEGDIVEVTNITSDGYISFELHTEVNGTNITRSGMTNSEIFVEHFKKVEEEFKSVAPTITQEYIEAILAHSDITVDTVFDKCTVVTCKLPNGFVIVESSACVSPENYDEEMGISICIDKIADKVWELEGYRLQEELYRNSIGIDIFDCNDCYCDECPCVESYDEEEDECLDCDDCDDYDCPYNTKS